MIWLKEIQITQVNYFLITNCTSKIHKNDEKLLVDNLTTLLSQLINKLISMGESMWTLIRVYFSNESQLINYKMKKRINFCKSFTTMTEKKVVFFTRVRVPKAGNTRKGNWFSRGQKWKFLIKIGTLPFP